MGVLRGLLQGAVEVAQGLEHVQLLRLHLIQVGMTTRKWKMPNLESCESPETTPFLRDSLSSERTTAR